MGTPAVYGLVLLAFLSVSGCGPAPAPVTEKKAEPRSSPPIQRPQPVKDASDLLPADHRTGSHTVPDHVLGNNALPGGTIGDYSDRGPTYQLFIIETPSSQDAAILLLDFKHTLQDADYLPNMGGYAGTYNGKPVYAFAKAEYLAGVAGLPRAKADPIARQLAAKLR